LKDITQIEEGTNVTPGGKEVASITYIRRRRGDDGNDIRLERDGMYRKARWIIILKLTALIGAYTLQSQFSKLQLCEY